MATGGPYWRGPRSHLLQTMRAAADIPSHAAARRRDQAGARRLPAFHHTPPIPTTHPLHRNCLRVWLPSLARIAGRRPPTSTSLHLHTPGLGELLRTASAVGSALRFSCSFCHSIAAVTPRNNALPPRAQRLPP